MSLIGSLEDLGLGDILQILSLSQKSGVLVIRSDRGEGRLVFRSGLVRGAAVKGGPNDLRAVLVGGGFVAAADFDAARADASAQGGRVEEALARRGVLPSERIDSLLRESVETAVMEMFRWRFGDFSFDMREELEADDPALLMPTGINAQYLAMECSRVSDETTREDGDPAPGDAGARESGLATAGVGSDGDDSDQDIVFAGESDAPPAVPSAPPPAAAGEATRAVSRASAAAPPGNDELMLSPLDEVDAVHAEEGALRAELVDVVVEAALRNTEAGMPLVTRLPVIVIDSELKALEWTKRVLSPEYERVHIFQRSDLGLTRIRQYLARGETPIVLLSPAAHGDPLSGIRGAVDFVKRLKAQSTRTCVLWLCEEGAEPLTRVAPAEGSVTRPALYQFDNAAAGSRVGQLATGLRQAVDAICRSKESGATSASSAREISPEVMDRLKRATALLREASSRGEVLPLVIRFAAETFSRVAMFGVRDGEVHGMAGAGLSAAGGPDDAALRQVSARASESAWLRRALETHAPFRAPASDEGDRALAARLGDRVASEVYWAPIESAGQVIALLYGDNLPHGRALSDSSALEVVLHHAGLALDRAALERALAESDS
jgi:hypothetical protein